MSQTLKLGPFQLDEVVGKGGMGMVYRGRHSAEGLPVAVKVLTTNRARKQRFHDAFRLEVEALARMNHPGIAMVLDVGKVNDQQVATDLGLPMQSPWLAMEFVEGDTLPRPEGDDRWWQLKQTLLQLLDSLAHAHALGVVHRDLKPSNLLASNVHGQMQLKLVDFGVALAVDERSSSVDDSDDGGRIRITGTPRYMSPEQILGQWRDQGPWTDLYAVGCIGWWLACGEAPFNGSATDMLRAHIQDPIPDFQPEFQVPRAFGDWLARLLQKSPFDRYRRAADAAYDLLRMAGPTIPGVEKPSASVQWGEETTIIRTLEETARLDSVPGEVQKKTLRSARTSGRSAPPTPPLATAESVTTTTSPQLLGAGLGLYGLRVVPVVDRDRERAMLWEAVREARSMRSPRLTFLRGPAGCGKSRLAQWVARRGHETGSLTALHATHSEFGGPHHGLGGMLSRHFMCQGLTREACLERMLQILHALGFDESERLYDAAGFAHMMTASTVDGEERTGFSSPRERNMALRRLFDRLTQNRALLLWMDDVQWAESSLSFVRFMLAEGEGIPLLIVLTGRDDTQEDARPQDDLQALLEEHSRRVIEVGPLPERYQRELVERLLRLAPGVSAQVTARTEGNPLFAVQLVGDWVERDLLEVGDEGFVVQRGATLDVPDDVHALWRGRIDRVLSTLHKLAPKEALGAFEIAAALGKEVARSEWTAALDQANLPAADELIESLHRRGLVHRTRDGWSFAHSMLHESVARTSREAGKWSEHHRNCAHALRTLHPNPTGSVLRRVAEHLLAAGHHEDALEPLFEAGLEARRAGDNREAAALLERRGRVLDELGISESDRRFVQNLWALGAIRQESGRPEEARTLVKQAMEVARARGFDAELGQALRLHGNLLRDAGEFEQSLRSFDEAGEALARTGDLEALAQNHVSRAGTHLMRGQLARARKHLQEAFGLFGQVGNESMRAKARHLIGYTFIAEGELEQANSALTDALELAREANNRALEANCWNNLGEVARAGARWDAARMAYQEAARLWRLSGHRDADIARLNLAMVEISSGRAETARQLLVDLEDSFARLGFRYAMPVVAAGLLCCDAADGDWTGWDERFRELVDLLDETRLVEKDIARLTEYAADVAESAGQPARAAAAFRIAMEQWNQLGSERDVTAVRDRIAMLTGEEG